MTVTGRDRPALENVQLAIPGIGDLQIPPVPDDPVSAAATFAHEMTHSFHGGDEYAGGGVALPADSVDFTQLTYWNLLVDREVRDQASRLSVDRMDGRSGHASRPLTSSLAGRP